MPLDEETRNPSQQASDASCGPAAAAWLKLSDFDNSDYDPGRGIVVRTLWYFCSVALFESGWLPVSGLKIRLLRLFGANVGSGVVIKPNVRIKFPWRLKVGDHCWIGQEVWIDNLDDVEIGDNVCISQLCYLCTGSHDHRRRTFDLIIRPIRIGAGRLAGRPLHHPPGSDGRLQRSRRRRGRRQQERRSCRDRRRQPGIACRQATRACTLNRTAHAVAPPAVIRFIEKSCDPEPF